MTPILKPTSTDASSIVSPAELRKLLTYDEGTGVLFWKERPSDLFVSQRTADFWNRRYAGVEAFTAINHRGYLIGRIFDQIYSAHRVAWAISTGAWPDDDIDHINGDKLDNRIVNLRAVESHQNAMNRKRPLHNTSGVMGVSWIAAVGKWRASIKFAGRSFSRGFFSNIEDAIAARKAAEIEFGFHENHGRDPAMSAIERGVGLDRKQVARPGRRA